MELIKILFIGDMFGKPGRQAVRNFLPQVLEEYPADLVLANGENAAGGKGLTVDVYREIMELGIHFLTSGNHIWDKKEFLKDGANCPNFIRPLNYSALQPGAGYQVLDTPRGPVAVVNLAGRVFMGQANDPFEAIDTVLPALQARSKVIFVDIHAETTSEKACMAWHLDGRASALVGTHTHVQTADERILPGGLGFITDVGMTGPRDSIIGAKIENALFSMRSGLKKSMDPAEGPLQFNACYFVINADTAKTERVERICRIQTLS